LFFTGLDVDENVVLVKSDLSRETDRGSINNCVVPLTVSEIRSANLIEGRRNVVESIATESPSQVQVRLYELGGVLTTFIVNLNSACSRTDTNKQIVQH